MHAALLLTLVALSGCGEEPAPDDVDSATATDTGSVFAGQDTGGADATLDCTSGASCPNGTHCLASTGACVVCTDTAHCTEGQLCTGNVCVAATCTTGDKTCQDLGHLATCVDGAWQVQACAADQVCADLACQSKACTPGEKRCTADSKAAETCGARGASWAKTPCQIDEGCVAGACVKHQCKPGKKTCGDGTTVLTCKPDGQGHDSEPCPAKTGCDPGYGTPGAQAFCKAWACTPGEAFCDGALAKTCAADGLEAKQTDNCNKNDALGKPMACKLGTCVSVKCEAGSFACLGWTVLGKCKTDGSDYDPQPCGKDLVCKEGACKPQTCAPGEAFCEGKIAKQCDKVGTGVTLIGDCGVANLDCHKGKCVKKVCTPDTKQCAPGGSALQVCDPGGYTWTSTPCKTGTACDGDACKPVTCTPGKGTCAKNVPSLCNATGTALVTGADCGAKVCVEGVCMAKDCPAGTATCKDLKTQLVCNANGVGGVAKPCPQGQICQTGKCKAVVCEPNKAWCDGTVGKKCATDGLKVVAEIDCTQFNQVCKEGGCINKGCGDGQCQKELGETCSSCAADCGACPFDGCTARAKAGCDKCTCEACVCQLDPSCCSGSWSGFCANLCKSNCGGSCP